MSSFQSFFTTNMFKKILLVFAIFALLLGGGAVFLWSQHEKSEAQNTQVAESVVDEEYPLIPTEIEGVSISEPYTLSTVCRMVVLGDSMVFDMADKLPDIFPIRGYSFSVVNAAVPGGGLFHKSIQPAMPERVLVGDYVLISIGANDVFEKEAEIVDGSYKKDLQAFVEDIIARGGKPLLLKYFGTDNEYFTKAQMDIINQKLNPMIVDIGAALNLPVLETEAAERRDGVHFSEAGMRFVIDEMLYDHESVFDPSCKAF